MFLAEVGWVGQIVLHKCIHEDEEVFMKSGTFRKKFIGDRKFYAMVLGIAVPIMIQSASTLRECGETVVPMKAGVTAVFL